MVLLLRHTTADGTEFFLCSDGRWHNIAKLMEPTTEEQEKLTPVAIQFVVDTTIKSNKLRGNAQISIRAEMEDGTIKCLTTPNSALGREESTDDSIELTLMKNMAHPPTKFTIRNVGKTNDFINTNMLFSLSHQETGGNYYVTYDSNLCMKRADTPTQDMWLSIIPAARVTGLTVANTTSENTGIRNRRDKPPDVDPFNSQELTAAQMNMDLKAVRLSNSMQARNPRNMIIIMLLIVIFLFTLFGLRKMGHR